MPSNPPFPRLAHAFRTLAVILILAACQLPRPAAVLRSLTPPFTPNTPISAVADNPSTPTTEDHLQIQPSSQPATGTLETQPSMPSPTETPTPPQNTQYVLDVAFHYGFHTLSVAQTITYWNTSSDVLGDLLLEVEANRYPGAFQLKSLAWGDGQPVSAYRLESNQLQIPFPQGLPPGEAVGLVLAYDLDLPPIPEPSDTVRPQPFGYTARQTNLVDWYPYFPPYRSGGGWIIHTPWVFGEHQVYGIGDYEVNIQLLDSPPGLVLAASASEVKDGDTYHYSFQEARSFAWSASPEYTVYTDTVGAVTVYSYGFPYYEQPAQAALRFTVEALSTYQDLYGPYPHASLSVVVADFLDGMEYDGLYFLSRGFYNLYDGTPAGYLTAIAVHETAHQWWYGLVGNDQALEPWLDEAFCTYSERLFYERNYPELVDWWWAFRVNFYQPQGVIDKTIYDYNGFRPYRDAVYLQGARFFEALRQRVGEEAFFSFIKDYAAQETHQLATAQDFFDILREHSPAGLDGLFQAYFSRTY